MLRTYDSRLVRAITALEEALNIPYVDPEQINMHARRLRLIGAAWRQNRVADPVYGGEEAGGDEV